ncbi:MAG: ABC transporter permease [Gammaproteobacteria bacterium]|nr:ABC transporter permease [Gammaproteobacteria bacterium]
MDFLPVVLPTDGLIFLLLVTVMVFAVYVRGKEHLRAPWREVKRSRMAAAALVVLLTYALIGLLDSLHFRLPLADNGAAKMEAGTETEYSTEVLSLLDVMAAPLRARVEKTYSAPFSAYLFARETEQRADGTEVRVFPRLKYGGRHLQDPENERAADILVASARAVAISLLIWLGVCAALAGLLARRERVSFSTMLRRILRGETETPWRVVLLTFFIILVVAVWAAVLSLKYHILGTDKVGQDVFYQALKSIRTGLVIGTLTTLVMLPFAVLLGIMAGYFRGVADDIIQYVYTTLSSIPGVLLIAAAILSLQVYITNHPEQFDTLAERADLRLLFLCVILGITSWTGLCRLLRGETLKLREMEYIQAAQAFGVGHSKIIRRHILPNVMHIVLISVVLDFSGLVLAEAVLSYVGVGVDPSTHSWGNMINGARLEMARDPMVWWSLCAAFVFMFTLVLAANLFSDVVRDAFDPRLRKQ